MRARSSGFGCGQNRARAQGCPYESPGFGGMDILQPPASPAAVGRLDIHHLPSHHASLLSQWHGRVHESLARSAPAPRLRHRRWLQRPGSAKRRRQESPWPRQKPRGRWACRAAGRRCREPANRRESTSTCGSIRARSPPAARSFITAEQTPRFQTQSGAQTLSPRKHRIAHRLVNARRILLRGRKDSFEFRVHQSAGLLKMLANCFG